MGEEKKSTDRNKSLDQRFWDDRYQSGDTGWDMGQVSPPLKAYIDQLTDKNTRIFIPGCGNAYEAEYLLQKGFTNITLIDIAPALVNKLNEKYSNNPNIKIVLADFFEYTAEFDLILEQTFFCALDPSLRAKYRDKMYSLLSPNGKLVGLLFNTEFEKEGPPFGGTKAEYEQLFREKFKPVVFEHCYNSHPKRQGAELFVILKKNSVV